MLKKFMRWVRFKLPWKQRIGAWRENPVAKDEVAGAEIPPPAPWVKIREGVEVWPSCALWREQRICLSLCGIEKLVVRGSEVEMDWCFGYWATALSFCSGNASSFGSALFFFRLGIFVLQTI